MEHIDTELDDQIQFIDEKVKWLMEHGESEIVLEMYTAILESLYKLKDLEK